MFNHLLERPFGWTLFAGFSIYSPVTDVSDYKPPGSGEIDQFHTTTMNNLTLTKAPVAKAAMLIRKPVAEVFEAFIDPAITTRFWFTKSTGRLEPGKHITWTWEMYDASAEVDVKEIEVNKRILIDWGGYGEKTAVEWIFTPYEGDATYVTVTNYGFKGDGDKVVSEALDSTGGFTWALAGLKALLEHNIELNAIGDAFPKGLSSS